MTKLSRGRCWASLDLTGLTILGLYCFENRVSWEIPSMIFCRKRYPDRKFDTTSSSTSSRGTVHRLSFTTKRPHCWTWNRTLLNNSESRRIMDLALLHVFLMTEVHFIVFEIHEGPIATIIAMLFV